MGDLKIFTKRLYQDILHFFKPKGELTLTIYDDKKIHKIKSNKKIGISVTDNRISQTKCVSTTISELKDFIDAKRK